MAGTEQIADRRARRRRRRRPGWCCRPKRIGTRPRPTGAFSSTKGIVFGVRDRERLVATAALLPYSGGNAWISMVLVTDKLAPPRPRHPAGRCLPEAAAQARPDHLARRDAGRRRRLRPARLHADAAIARLRLERRSAARGDAQPLVDRRPRRAHRARSRGHRVRSQRRCCANSPPLRLAAAVARRAPSHWFATAERARHIGPLFAGPAATRAGAGRCDRRDPRPDRC